MSLYVISLLCVIIGIIIDQYTKHLAVMHLQDAPIPLIEGVFELQYLENRGAAFGMLQNKQWFFLIITVVLLFFIIYGLSSICIISSTLTASLALSNFGLGLPPESILFTMSREEISSEVVKQPTNKIVRKVDVVVASRNGSASNTSENTSKEATVKVMNVSAYCSCKSCCGKTNGITSSGNKAQAWYTVAAGSGYPIGTRIYIPYFKDQPNGGWFVVQDRGGAISNGKLDIYMNSHSEALSFGRKNLECYIYN